MSHILTIDGDVESPAAISFDELNTLPETDVVIDVSRIDPRRQGDGIEWSTLMTRVKPTAAATHLTLHATTDGFSASIPLDALGDDGLIVFRIDGEPLKPDQGGPFRFLLRNPAACATGELDDCANVKFLDRIELTAGKGRDSRSPCT